MGWPQFLLIKWLKVFPDQIWYWGNVDKSMVSEIMQDQPEGTFMVRDASSPGDYTLTDKITESQCQLSVKRNGFGVRRAHKTKLQCYNAQLDVCLKYPLPRRKNSVRTVETVSLPASVSPPLPAFNPDWELRLGLERLRIYQTSVDRAARLFDAVHEEKKMADDLHYEYTQAIIDLERKVKQLEDVLSTLQSCRESNDETDLKRVHTFKANAELVEKGIKKLKEEREFVVDRRARVAKIIEDLEQASTHAKERLVSCHNTRNQSYTELYKKGVPKHKLGETIEHATSMLEKETMQASELLADIPLTWEPEHYLVNDPSKEAAAVLILQARARLLERMGRHRTTDGIFLIRPSASQTNKLVLSVLHGERVSHCLIGQTSQGWGFENGGVYFVTIGDFVRYYANASLEEHNSEIKTTLTMPAL
ncbi:SH2 domain protein [Ostertagia ostertagi]